MPMNIKDLNEPIRYPVGQDGGPWGVCSIGMSWWIANSNTMESQRVGLIGRPDMFALALAEAARRNIEGDIK